MRCLRCQSGPGSRIVVHECGPMGNIARDRHGCVPAWSGFCFLHLRDGNECQGLEVGLGSVVGTFSWDVRVVVACCRHGHCCSRFLFARLRRGCSQVLLHKLGLDGLVRMREERKVNKTTYLKPFYMLSLSTLSWYCGNEQQDE